MVFFKKSGVRRRRTVRAPWADLLPFILFAGLPLKRVAATGIAHPRDQRRNLFFDVYALDWEGGTEQGKPCLSMECFPPAGKNCHLMMMRGMEVMHNRSFQREQERSAGNVPPGGGLPQDRHGAGEKDEEKE
jgi:hypothetical protein